MSAYTIGHTKSTMTSYNAIGACYTARNAALMNEVARGEWGFDGMFITDAGSCTDTPLLTLASGTDMFCLGGTMGGAVVDAVNAEADGYGLQVLRDVNKHFYSVYANSLARNGLSADTSTAAEMQAWLIGVYVVDAVVGLAAVLMLILFAVAAHVKKEGKDHA